MAVQYDLGIWRACEGSVPTKLPVHALPSIGTAAPREGSHSGASSPPYPHLPRLASRTSFAHLSSGTVLSLDSLTSATSASANSEHESDVLVLFVA